MRYTTTTNTDKVHVTRVAPLDPQIVRLALTVRIPDFKKVHAESTLSLYAALAMTGTAQKSKHALLTYLRKHGITFEVQAGCGTLQYNVSVRKANMSFVTALLTEIIFAPKLFKDDFNAKKQLLLEDNRESRDNAKKIAGITFNNMLYPDDSPLHEQTLEVALAEIKKLSLKSLSALHHAIPHGEWFVTLVSDSSVAALLTPLITKLDTVGAPVLHANTERPILSSCNSFITVPGKTNVEIRMGNTIPISPFHEDFVALDFGIDVLGKVGGFSGRLMSTVREKEGLTYGIYATTVENDPLSTIHYTIYTFFAAKDLEKGLIATKREIARLVEKGITSRELIVFKDILMNQYLIAHESNLRRLALYHALNVHGYSEEFLLDRIEKMQALTTRSVNAAVRTYIDPTRLIVSGAGPVTTTGEAIG